MKWLVFFIALVCSPAFAQQVGFGINFGQTCPGPSPICQGLPPRGIVSFDLTTGSIPAAMSFSRSSVAWYFNSSGLLTQAASGNPRFDYAIPGGTSLYGLLVEAASTNLALWSRDLTQSSAWTVTSATTALDQTGIDGVASSASSITASAANGTVCQGVSHASASAAFSVYLKRISGTGGISISMDGGAYYGTVAPASNWTRFSLTETVANPIFCIQLATLGDKIAVDVAQIEYPATAAGYVSSPIVTTSSSVTRAAELLSVSPLPWYNSAGGSYVFQWRQQSFGGSVTAYEYFNTGYGMFVNNGNLSIVNFGSNCLTPTLTGVNKGGASYKSTGFTVGAVNNSTCPLSGTTPSASTPTSLNFVNTWVQKFTYWNYPLTAAQLQTATR